MNNLCVSTFPVGINISVFIRQPEGLQPPSSLTSGTGEESSGSSKSIFAYCATVLSDIWQLADNLLGIMGLPGIITLVNIICNNCNDWKG